MDWFVRFNNVITIISFVVNAILIVKVMEKGYAYFTKKRYVKKVLGYNKEAIQISFSVFEKKETDNTNTNFVTYSGIVAINNIITLLTNINYKFYLSERKNEAKNEMNIGGFYANKIVNAYFIQYFANFKYLTGNDRKEVYEKHYADMRMFQFTEDGTKGFMVGDVFLEVADRITDFAFFIKLVESDFNNDNEKTVHIVFGGTAIGTIKATEYLLQHCKQIYEMYGEKHYFFALEINLLDNSINYSRGIIDLTNEMFE